MTLTFLLKNFLFITTFLFIKYWNFQYFISDGSTRYKNKVSVLIKINWNLQNIIDDCICSLEQGDKKTQPSKTEFILWPTGQFTSFKVISTLILYLYKFTSRFNWRNFFTLELYLLLRFSYCRKKLFFHLKKISSFRNVPRFRLISIFLCNFSSIWSFPGQSGENLLNLFRTDNKLLKIT